VQASRQQLTLFISDQNETIEKVRATFNPAQFRLIAAHVTLCREDEIVQLANVVENIKSILLDRPIRIEFGLVERFDDGKGVLLPAKVPSNGFYELRRMVLKGLNEFPIKHLPHITLLHPRNAVCTDKVFDQIKEYALPTALSFDTISLIEQRNNGRWTIIEQFSWTKK